MTRDEARNYFKNNNLNYSDISMNEIYNLIQILNKKIFDSKSFLLMMNTPKNKDLKFKNYKLVFCELKVSGTYFASREAITFNEDGFIGIAGWADGYITDVFTTGFIEWCDYLRGDNKCMDI